MKLSTLLFLSVVVTAPHTLTAQFPAAPREPVWFTTLGVGLQFGGVYIVDDATQSTWDFDAGIAWAGTVERNVSRDIAVGLAWQYARLPLAYRSLSQTGPCTPGCGADATVAYAGVLGRYGGGGLGFQRILELSVGAMRYGSFEATPGSGGGRLAPESGNIDFAVGVGGGFGYGISQDWQVMIVQGAMNTIHERSQSPSGAGRITQHYSTRVGVRIGW